MAATPFQRGIRLLCRAAAPSSAGVTDAELLERFVGRQDEAAFELLAWRHGSMVLGTCRRVLRDAHEAEDVVQAVFLVLARRASVIGRRGSVGGWLHRVALRLAVRARARRDRRGLRERPLDEFVAATAPSDPPAEAGWREVRRILDEEVDRLPEAYRLPFVLCCLEARSNADVAREFGCPIGTIESRLSRARRRLETRLSRRGVVPATGLLAILAAREATAFVQIDAPLVSSTAQAALMMARPAAAAQVVPPQVTALADAALRDMWMTKLRAAAAAVMVAAVVGTGTGVLFDRPAAADTPGKAPDAPKSSPPVRDEAARIADLVACLGSPAFAVREKAAKELDTIGAPALDALRKAATGDEPERKKRADELIKTIETRLTTAKLLDPRRVRLDYADVPLAEAVADFKAKSGYDIGLSDPDGRLKDRKVTVKTGEVTFWQALDRFCRAAELVEATAGPVRQPPAGGGVGGAAVGRGIGAGAGARALGSPPVGTPFAITGKITLADGKPTTRPTDDSTAVRVRVADQHDRVATNTDKDFAIGLEIALEPRLRWRRTVGVDIAKATDADGQSLEQAREAVAVPPARRVGVGGAGDVGGTTGIATTGSTIAVRLKKGAKPSSALEEISGTIALEVLREPERYLTVDEILGAAGKTAKADDGGSLWVIEVSKQAGGRTKVRVAINLGADGAGALLNMTVRAGRAVLSTGHGATAEHELSLVDDKGERLTLASAGIQVAAAGAEYVLECQPAAGQGGPAKLVYEVSRSATVDVPFKLKDVPVVNDK